MAMTATDDRTLRTVTQAMERLSCSRAMIYKLCNAGKLERVKFGAHTRITERSLNRFLDDMLKQNFQAPPIQPDDNE